MEAHSLIRQAMVPMLSFALGLALLPPAAAQNVSELEQAVVGASLAGPGVAVTGRTIAYGHLTLELGSGRLFPVVAGERVVGVFFRGSATLAYAPPDDVEAAVYAHNVKTCSNFSLDSAGVLRDSADSFLLYMVPGAGELAGGEVGTVDQVPAEAAAAFAEHRERFAKDRGVRPEAVLPQALVEPPAQAEVLAQIEGGKEDLLYLFDPMREQDESLAVLRKVRSDLPFLKNLRYPYLLSSRPIGRPPLEPREVPFVLTAVDVEVVNPKGPQARITAHETYQAIKPVNVLPLALWSRRVGTVGAGSHWEEKPYVLDAVELDGAGALPFDHVDGDLTVELPRVLQPGESVQVAFTMHGDVLFNPGNDSYWELPTGAWLPVPRKEMQFFTYHAVVKVPKPFEAFSDGATVRRWEEGEMACAEFREDKPISIPVVLAGKYVTTSETRNGITVSASSYVMADTKSSQRLINNAFSLMEFYAPFMGPYPFSELKIIEINSYGFGQAPAGVIFMTKEAFSPLQDEVSRAFSQGINARLAHEMAHTWWGHVAKLGADEDQWLSESIAEYMAAFAMGEIRRKSEFKKAYDEWKGQARFVKDRGTVYLANQLDGDDAEGVRYALLYAKGPLVLHELRKQLGDSTFFTVLKSFLKSFNFKLAQTKHFIGLTSFVAKKDYRPFFDRYLLGTDWP